MFRKSFTLFIVLLGFASYAQVPVNINSGNPAIPFPQFLAYDYENGHHLENLGTQWPAGVTHAEMEQDIRDAYQIMANRFIYTGVVHKGIKLIKGNEGCPYDCSEGEGYAMLAAAYMGDKTTFDGLWIRNHDERRATKKKYTDCTILNPNYRYGNNTLTEGGFDAASDGSFDIALALLVAWKQWGEFMGINDACDNPISYKKEALEVIKGLVEVQNQNLGDCRSISGLIGLDGYVKNGNTWGETTSWASTKDTCPEFKGSQALHVDYMAPSYFREFRKILETEGETGWNNNQFLRAEASSDWITGQVLKNPLRIPVAGWGEIVYDSVIFQSFHEAEDFRFSWRTNLNYMWHGNPDFTWNPITHQVEKNSSNTFEKDVANRYASFLANNNNSPWNNNCTDYGNKLSYFGPVSTKNHYSPNGEEMGQFPINWIPGAAASSAVSAEDFELMGEFYRQCVIEFDVSNAGDGYLTSTPKYFHGWFRLLGMLTYTGNYLAPENFVPKANLKVYQSVNKTVAFTNEEVTFRLDYRNYGSVNATNTVLTTQIDSSLQILAINNGGTFNPNTNTISWNIGTVAGFKTGDLAQTKGFVSYTVSSKSKEEKHICITANISCDNGFGSSSSPYPNNDTSLMERNCLDILGEGISLQKIMSSDSISENEEIITSLIIENKSSTLLTGGRPDVFLSYAHNGTTASTFSHQIKTRLFHGAKEPYIDYGNYRISLFINDNSPLTLRSDMYEGGDAQNQVFAQEMLLPNSNQNGAWNKKISIQFDHELATTTPHLSYYRGIPSRIHQGTDQNLFTINTIHHTNYNNIQWSDDWSWNAIAVDDDKNLFYPISPSSFNPEETATQPVNVWHKYACEKPSTTIENVLIEEWDGYVWRKILGNAPVSGFAHHNVVLSDTLSPDLEFIGFTQNTSGIDAIYNPSNHTIQWTASQYLIGAKDTISYAVRLKDPKICATNIKTIDSKTTLSSDKKPPSTVDSQVILSCNIITNTIEEIEASIRIYPTAVENELSIKSNLDCNYSIVSFVGEQIISGKVSNGMNSLSVSKLSSGAYLFKANGQTIKFIKY